VPTNGTRLSVAVGGTGPTLVLLHGWPQTDQADDVRRVLTELGLPGPAAVVGHELEFITATFRAMSIEGISDDDLAAYAAAYRGRDRLRGGFAHYWTLLTDGAENRRLLAAGPLRTPVLVVGAGAHGATDPAAALRPHVTDVTGAVAPTGHFVAEEAPEWLVAELRRFLAEHQG
jgi:pimeloyl-ACP methyl ester carboxylesterase